MEQAFRGTGGGEPHCVALAVLELLTADPRPLLVAVEDAQWLDQPSWDALAFVCHRIEADAVAVLAAMLEGAATAQRLDAARLPALEIAPLGEAPAAAFLDRDEPTVDLVRMVAHSGDLSVSYPPPVQDQRVGLAWFRGGYLGGWSGSDRLRTFAAAILDALVITPWADRCRAEPAASGETLRRPEDRRDRLTRRSSRSPSWPPRACPTATSPCACSSRRGQSAPICPVSSVPKLDIGSRN